LPPLLPPLSFILPFSLRFSPPHLPGQECSHLHFSGAHSAKSSDGVSMNTFLPLRISVDFVNVTVELDDDDVVVVVVVVVVVLLVLDCKW